MKENDIGLVMEYLKIGLVDIWIDELYATKNEKDGFKYGLEKEELLQIEELVKSDEGRTKTIGQFLNEKLYELQMTQSDVANRSGLTKGVISNIINGRHNPSKYKMVKIAIAMKLDVDETVEFLETMGYKFNKTLKDKIIFACLNLGITDMIKIEEALNKVVDANESLFA
ncbi:helix-turn-helix transcriptional regulator [Metasolibacillus sp. FSL K6-0083]|uniref:helix-turn-helix domain-containing protein n=1 Tax=Metasolibacillus sp. FSL K6-0083 TaxID=2921416 RepID=UPI00315AE1DE